MQGALVLIACGAEVLKVVMMITHHFGGLVPVKDIYDMFRFVFLVYLLDGLKCQLQQLARIHLFIYLAAVVAVAAVVLVVFLAEIVQQQFAPAYSALRITLRLEQQLVPDAYLFRCLVFLEPAQTLYVVRRIETQTVALAAVTTGTPCLLIIAFQRFRDVIMYHETHIRLVDTHAERYRCYYHLAFLHQERVLVGAASRGIHPGVIGARADAVHLQHLCQILHFLARETIYYTALALHTSDETDKVFVHILGLRTHFIVQVRAVETALEDRRVFHPEVLLDVFLHFRRRGRGQSDDGCLADTLNHRTDLAVFRTEVMTPFRDTMCLVNGVETDFHPFQKVHVLVLLKTLRCKV